MIKLHDRMLLDMVRIEPQPPDHQSDAHPIEPLRPVTLHCLSPCLGESVRQLRRLLVY